MTLICLRDGCMNPILNGRPERRYCCDSHRVAQWKAEHPNGPQNGLVRISGPSRSGLQVSYPKAVRVLTIFLRGIEPNWHNHEATAELILVEALSPAQRARLEARQ